MKQTIAIFIPVPLLDKYAPLSDL